MSENGPWLSFNRTVGLNASNTLYTIRFRNSLNAGQRVAVALALLTTEVRTQMNHLVRRYPGGLKKLEPSDLSSLLLPSVPQQIDQAKVEQEYGEAISRLLLHDTKAASRIADKFFAGMQLMPASNEVG
jgi:hypothetical protein